MVISIDSEEHLIHSQAPCEQNNIRIRYRSTRSHMTNPYLKVQRIGREKEVSILLRDLGHDRGAHIHHLYSTWHWKFQSQNIWHSKQKRSTFFWHMNIMDIYILKAKILLGIKYYKRIYRDKINMCKQAIFLQTSNEPLKKNKAATATITTQ